MRGMTSELSAILLKECGRRWSKLSLSENVCNGLAVLFAAKRNAERTCEILMLSCERQYVEDRTADSIAADGISNHMSSMRFSTVELRQMCEDIGNCCPRRLAELS